MHVAMVITYETTGIHVCKSYIVTEDHQQTRLVSVDVVFRRGSINPSVSSLPAFCTILRFPLIHQKISFTCILHVSTTILSNTSGPGRL